MDHTSKSSFSHHFVRAKIIRIQDHVSKYLQSTPSFDTMTYKLFMSLSIDVLLQFFNMCLDLHSAPCLWMITILIRACLLTLQRSRYLVPPVTYVWTMCSSLVSLQALIFGRQPRVIPAITLQGRALKWTDDTHFLGVVFCSMAMDIFHDHSIQLTKKALHVCNVTFVMECFLGDIHPHAGLSIYSTHVDSILTYGTQIVVIMADSMLRHLKKVQTTFLHCLLHVHKCSMTAILFSETGFTLIWYWQLNLTLWYLLRLLIKHNSSSKLTALGINACHTLWC